MTEDKDDSTPELDKYEETQPEESPLTPRQEIFCQNFIIDFNATKAAIRSGYAESNAGNTASLLRTKSKIQKRIGQLMEEKRVANMATVNFVLARLIQAADIDMKDAYDEHGRLKEIKDMPEALRKSIVATESFVELEGNFRGAQPVGEVRKVKFMSKERVYEMLGRHLKIFTDKVEHSNPDGTMKPMAVMYLPENYRDKAEEKK